MRVALVSPYSWSYPGGVTRHIDSLAKELRNSGHEVSILAPYDPADVLSRRCHGGAAPQGVSPPAGFISLGRTIGIPANGAVSNLAVSPKAIRRLRRLLREGRYDVVHIHEPVAPMIGWDAMSSTKGSALVGTYHSFSQNALTNGIGCLMGARRRMARLHARIAVSEAAAWTGRHFFGGDYSIVPNGVDLIRSCSPDQAESNAPEAASEADPAAVSSIIPASPERALRILFIGQPVARKGLSILLRAFEALREQVPATLTLVGTGPDDVGPLLLDISGVSALGRVSEQDKQRALASADVLCAPSLHGESFGMVLTEAFAAGIPVVASDIDGYRDVVRDQQDGLLVAPGDPVALAEALRAMALDAQMRNRMAQAAQLRAERYAWPRVAADVIECYESAIALARKRAQQDAGRRDAGLQGMAADRASLGPRRARMLPRLNRRIALLASSLSVAALAIAGLSDIGVGRVEASLAASKPGLLIAGFSMMAFAMATRALAWHLLMRAMPGCKGGSLRDAMQGTAVGVLMSATLPARLGEPSRALIVARRLGDVRARLPGVLGAQVAQMLLNLIAVCVLGVATALGARQLQSHDALIAMLACIPVAGLLVLVLAPMVLPGGMASRSLQSTGLSAQLRVVIARVRQSLLALRSLRWAPAAMLVQLLAWGMQLLSCWLVLAALGLSGSVSMAGAAAVLFAVNVTALLPATPGNVGVFQIAVLAVLAGVYQVSGPVALAYGVALQGIELLVAVAFGVPALTREGISWRELRSQSIHALPVQLRALPGDYAAAP